MSLGLAIWRGNELHPQKEPRDPFHDDSKPDENNLQHIDQGLCDAQKPPLARRNRYNCATMETQVTLTLKNMSGDTQDWKAQDPTEIPMMYSALLEPRKKAPALAGKGPAPAEKASASEKEGSGGIFPQHAADAAIDGTSGNVDHWKKCATSDHSDAMCRTLAYVCGVTSCISSTLVVKNGDHKITSLAQEFKTSPILEHYNLGLSQEHFFQLGTLMENERAILIKIALHMEKMVSEGNPLARFGIIVSAVDCYVVERAETYIHGRSVRGIAIS
ncbi:hypothetical protein C8J57DRAFT_1500362 [Mycena rebaudengoi]|nr:hypothetical protein C8J57DRAFT_1500362 [Mycena rebaudengoi]